MKKIVLLIITLFLTAQTIKAQTVVLDANGVTVKWTGTTVPSPYFVQASPRGTLEWFAIVDNSTKDNITNYAKNIQSGITYFTRPSTTTPIPFSNIVTTLVTNMSGMFTSNGNGAFFFINPPNIDSWDVSNVTDMSWMFYGVAFNQPIGSWNVSNVTDMRFMFYGGGFNQPIGSWNVSNVISMEAMFTGTYFNQNISTWNVSNVNNMYRMFESADAFNQPIGDWNVSNVTNMGLMFADVNAFDQNIGSWNVSNVTYMGFMFYNHQISTANYDALLIGWSTISSNETPLKPNVVFSGGNSKYCNGATARASIINNYGWTITDAGLETNCVLATDEFDAVILKLYPNPVLSILNVKVDSNLINQSYNIVDSLGRVILKGNINDVDTSINVEQLSKGIYYIKVSDNIASKFVKE